MADSRIPTSGMGESRVEGVLRRLTEPAASVREPGLRRRARLLSALLATQFLLSFLVTLLILSTVHAPSEAYLGAASTLILAAAYFLSRTRYYETAALLAIGTLSGSVFAAEIAQPDPSVLFFLILGVLMSSLFLSRWATVMIMAATIAGIGLLFRSTPELPARDALGAMFAVFCVGVLGMVAIAIRRQDLEEIQRQSVSLRQSEERFHLISYATNDVVWDWDFSTGQVWRNQSVLRLFGYKDDQVRPEMGWWEERIHPEERDKVLRHIRESIEIGENFWSKEYRFRRADDSFIHVFDRAYIIRDESGSPLRMLGAMMDITARKQAEEVLRQESLHDPLTGLFNRRYMEEMVEREILRAERNGQPISFILLDVDRFKHINDTFGHAAGDTVLRNLGAFLLKHVRGADIACRYGGDEFVLILPGATWEVIGQRAESIRSGAQELLFEPYGKLPGGFTLSLGVAIYPEHGATLKEILAAADAALYQAKQTGRGRVALAENRRRAPDENETGRDESGK